MPSRHDSLLDALTVAEVQSVSFVRDYLEIGLHLHGCSPVLTFWTWPEVVTADGVSHYPHERGYRDALCSMIDDHVLEGTEDAGLKLDLASGACVRVTAAMADTSPIPEIAMLRMNDDAGQWTVWRPGEGPLNTRD